ncbi:MULTISPECIES: Na+/H+ antiporter NhaA [unclassified Blastococcus]
MTAATQTALAAGVRRLSGSDTGAAAMLLAATVVALVWANLPGDGYESFWHTPVSLAVGGDALELDLRHWVNDALMALFFFLVSLEVKRELVLGELRDHQRVRVPAVAAVLGLLVPAVVFWAITTAASESSAVTGAWGVVISTDTAFVLGLIALAGRAAPVNLRVFVLTLAIIDDVGALGVIAVVYTDQIRLAPALTATAGLVAIAALRRLRVWRGPVYLLAAVLVWGGVLASGVHATVAGVLIGLLMPVHPPSVAEVEEAERRARAYGQSPTPERARTAVLSLTRAVSVNERLQRLMRPWVSFLVVPVFALANAGVRVDVPALTDAFSSALTWAVVAGLVLGKTVGIAGSAAVAVRTGLGHLPPGLFGRHLVTAGLLSGVGFTISLFIVDLALADPTQQSRARIGVLTASMLAAVLALAAFAVVRVVDRTRGRDGQRLVRAVTPGRDHVRGSVGAPLELVVYASFTFTTAGRAVEVVDELHEQLGEDLVFAFRHLPTAQPGAHEAAQASEAAAAQRRFWPMHDAMAARRGRVDVRTVRECAVQAGLNLARLDDDLRRGRYEDRVREDERDAEAMGLEGPPVFFVNGQLYGGPLETEPLRAALLQSAHRTGTPGRDPRDEEPPDEEPRVPGERDREGIRPNSGQDGQQGRRGEPELVEPLDDLRAAAP